MTAGIRKLQWLWMTLVQKHGVPHTTIHNLVSHAQDIEVARIQSLLDDMLKDPARLRAIDGDIIIRGLRDVLETKEYRAK